MTVRSEIHFGNCRPFCDNRGMDDELEQVMKVLIHCLNMCEMLCVCV